MRPTLFFKKSNPFKALASLIGLAGVLGGFTFLSSACGKGGGASFDPEAVIAGSCSVQPDQRSTFMAKVSGFPIRVLVDSEFTAPQRDAILKAAAKWNELGHRLVGTDFFTPVDSTVSDSVRKADPTQCGGTFGSSREFSILRESVPERWKLFGFGSQIPGATLRCFGSEEVKQQIIMLYTPVINDAQFMSVILHELGHSLGLDHSCSYDKASDKFKGCSSLADSHPYHAAVMFPEIRKEMPNGLPELKEEVRANDSLRTSCMYGN